VVQQATLNLALVESDATADATYTMTAHTVVGKNPVIASATGYTADGASPWTPSACCYSGVPLAQADLSAPYASLAVDKTPGFKTWTVTAMVQEWLASPASNAGLLLNSDATAGRDRYRYFASTKYADATLRPRLQITYSLRHNAPVISCRPIVDCGIVGDDQRTTNEGGGYRSTTDRRPRGNATGVSRSGHRPHPSTERAVDASVPYRARSRNAATNMAVSGRLHVHDA
jgi:hypothetical protein